MFNSTGVSNTASGSHALYSNTIGVGNTSSGANALTFNTSGNANNALGQNALYHNTTGSENNAVGDNALDQNTTGSNNIAIGGSAGSLLTTGSYNIDIGHRGAAADGYTTRIGFSQTRTFIAGIRGTTTGLNDAVPVVIDSSGQLGTTSSSLKVKQDVEDVGEASERILGLRPVRFRYKEQAARGDTTPQFGLIAEEVAKVFPELVVYDKQGQPETVKYHLLTPLLLGEVQRQARELADARQEIADLREQNAALAPLVAEMEALKRRVEAMDGAEKRVGRPAASGTLAREALRP